MLDRVQGLARPGLVIVFFSALLGVSSSVDEFLVLFLRQNSGEALLPALSRNFDFLGAVLSALAHSAFGSALALGAAGLGGRTRRRSIEEILTAISRAYVTLVVPVGLTLATALSLWISPSYPYGIGLAPSLALEGSFADLLSFGLFGASFAHALWFVLGPWEGSSLLATGARRWLAPLLVVGSLALFTLATPSEFYRSGFGQGNTLKYLRMASAVAGSGTLDIARAEENPNPTPSGFLAHLPGIAARYVAESRSLASSVLGAAARGEIYAGEMTATRANRSMFRDASGGIYYINAPGPGLLLVPAHLLDGLLNRMLEADRQIAVILFWQLLGALLVCEVVLSATEIAGRTSAVLVASAVAFSVPVLFYTFQIYPELPAALFLLHAFRKLALDPLPSTWGTLSAGIALAALPWLHQKYSVVAAVLALYGALRFARKSGSPAGIELGKLALLATPLLLSAYSIFLYNHALTGSLSPTATFSAAGRSSFEPLSFPKGFLGLLLDRENGLFVFSPFYLLALVGLPALADRHRTLLGPFLLVVASYVLVIASFPYWPGAVSTMGRYILSVLPLLALPAALAVRKSLTDGYVAGCAVVLTAASLAMSASFVRDLVPSYQPTLLWDRVLYSDPLQYLPSFLSAGLLGSGPAHYPKLLVQILAVVALVYLLRDRVLERAALPEAQTDRFPRRAAAAAGALVFSVVALGALLERMPGNATSASKPVFRETRDLGRGLELSVLEGEHGFEGEGVWVPGGGSTRFLLLSQASLHEVTLSLSGGPEPGAITMQERGGYRASLELPPGGPHDRTVLLRDPLRFDGPRGERFLYLFSIRSRGGFVPAAEGWGDDRRRLGIYVVVR